MTYQSEVARLVRVMLRHPRDAFSSQRRIAEQWRALGYLSEPDFDLACREHDDFSLLLESFGVRLEWMTGEDLGLDSIYVRDASVVSDRGVIPCRMGKPARSAEPDAQAHAMNAIGVETAGTIESPGTLEGGDVTWLAPDLAAVGRGYRTNETGIEQLASLLPGCEVVPVPLPHWKGPDDVFHLMSVLSPLDDDLLLVYSPLLSVAFREDVLARGFTLVEVPDEEFQSQGCNVLAVAPRLVVALSGNDETRRRMESAGVEVHTYVGNEISVKGCGGPTCLTRPLDRE